MKKLAIFDFDGTVMDSVQDVFIHLNEALSMHDFPILGNDQLVKYLGGNIDEIVSLVLKDQSSPENIKLVKDTYLKIYYSSEKKNTVPFPKSHEILEKLQEKGLFLQSIQTDSRILYRLLSTGSLMTLTFHQLWAMTLHILQNPTHLVSVR